MSNFIIRFKNRVFPTAHDVWEMTRFQINYIGLKGNDVFIQTTSKHKKKYHMWNVFTKFGTVLDVNKFTGTPTGMFSNVGVAINTRHERNVLRELFMERRVFDDEYEDNDFNCDLAHDDDFDQNGYHG